MRQYLSTVASIEQVHTHFGDLVLYSRLLQQDFDIRCQLMLPAVLIIDVLLLGPEIGRAHV